MKQLFLILLCLSFAGVRSQNLLINQSNGTKTAYLLSNLRKISFDSGNLLIQKTDNSIGEFIISGLRSLNFSSTTTGLINPFVKLSKTSLNVYPNPVVDVLNIDMSSIQNQTGKICIYTVEGMLMLTQVISNESIVSIKLNSLQNGIYICRFGNGEEFKTTRIIKK